MSFPRRRPVHVLAAGFLASLALAGLTECLTFNGAVARDDEDAAPEGHRDVTVPPVIDTGTPPVMVSDASDGGIDYSQFPAYLSVDDAVHLCSRMFDCAELSETVRYSMGIAYLPGNFSQCVDTFSGPLPPSLGQFLPAQQKLLQCVLAATSCTSALACLPYEIVAEGDPRCETEAGSDFVGCTGNDLLQCNPQDSGIIFHCDSTGFPDASFCSNDVDDCITDPSCDDSKYGCVGTVLRGCDTDDGGYWGLDCAIFGQSCKAMGMNSDCYTGSVEGTGCAPGSPLASCPSDFSNTLQVCTLESINLINCGDLGATCTPLQSFAYCALQGATCTPFDANVNVCDDNGNISLCVRGQPVTYSCANAGLTCGPDMDGQSNGCR